ncbi:MAG: XrtA system polysaccharide chain length determinant [Aquabacterium sp.]
MEDGSNPLLVEIRRILQVLHQRRWLVLGVVWVAALISMVGVGLMKERHEASARIFVDTQTVLKPMLRDLAYQPDIDQQVRMLARTLITRPKIQRLLERPDMSAAFDNPANPEAVVSRLLDQIKIVAADRGNIYNVTYRDTNLKRARLVVEGTVDLFVSAGTDVKKKDSVEAGQFIEQHIATTEGKLVAAESRLKDFKVRNFGLTGVSPQDHFARLGVLSEEVTQLRSTLRAAEQSRDAFRRELAAEDPRLPAESLPGAAPPVANELDLRIDAQRRQLDELLRRYTDAHPDVIHARQVVTRLEQERRQAAERRASEGERTRGNAATSPVFQRIRISLAESEAQVASLKSQLAAKSGQLDEARSRAGRVPQVEAELAQLNRDYEVVRRTYDQLVARRESASLGVKLDESSQLADFRVIEPARVTPTPVFPSRLHLGLIGLVASIGIGVAVALGLEKMHPTVRGVRMLEQLSGRPVLGTVGFASTPAWVQASRRDWRRLIVASVLLLALQGAWLGWLLARSVSR